MTQTEQNIDKLIAQARFAFGEAVRQAGMRDKERTEATFPIFDVALDEIAARFEAAEAELDRWERLYELELERANKVEGEAFTHRAAEAQRDTLARKVTKISAWLRSVAAGREPALYSSPAVRDAIKREIESLTMAADDLDAALAVVTND